MKKSRDNLNSGFTVRKSVDGMVGVPRTRGVGGVVNGNSHQSTPHNGILNKKTIQVNPVTNIRPVPRPIGANVRPVQRPVPVNGQAGTGHPRPRSKVTAQDVINRSEKKDLDSSLSAIDLQEKKPSKKNDPKRKEKRRKIIKRVAIAVAIIIILVIGYVVVKAVIAGNKSFQGGMLGFVQKSKLQQDANGRSNILIFGTSEDSDGGNHPGGNLTDSIMVLSLNQTKKDAYMISLPRDLWVKLDAACSVGYEEKLNTVYMCASDDGKEEQKGADALRKKVGQVLGLDVQYYAHLNYKVVADAVNAVGGVDVKIETEDPRGIYDPNFDWMCKHQCKMVNYKNGEIAHLDGLHALALARARNAQGGYGLPGGNFDRERNQQKILRALQEKALSAGTLSNLGKITGLIDALGNNLRTNINTSEVRSLIDLAQEIQGDKLQSIALDKEGEAVVTTGNYLGRSVVMPVAGIFDYSGIKSLISKNLSDNQVAKESATVAVYNGSGIAGLAKKSADELKAKGLSIGEVGNAPGATRQTTEIYQVGDGLPATKALLESHYNVKVTTGGTPPVSSEGAQFIVILGVSAQ